MRPIRLVHALIIVGALAALPLVRAQNFSTKAQPAAQPVEAVFQKFWAAKSSADAAKLVADVVKTGISFDEAAQRLKAGRTYAAQPGGKVINLSNRTSDGITHWFSVNVPANYDPARRYQVRFQLHGGVGGRTTNEPRGTGEIGSLAGAAEQFYVLPYAWADAPWWSVDQVQNLAAIVDELKRTYNVDENRVVVSGVSDGGTGAYYIAMRETTPFASFLPLNGFIMVLSNDEIDDGNMFPDNLRNKPLFAVNGGKDPLYPMARVEPYLTHLMSKGIEISYHPRPEAAHNTAWWPEMKDTFEQFVTDHPRDPHPDKLTWETSDLVHNRAHWLVIDQLGSQPGDSTQMTDANVMAGDFLDGSLERSKVLFGRGKAPGRVDLVKTGNTVQAATKGVAAFTLLLSPEKFDFKQPVKVIANGREVFNGRVERSVETLMKWAARDNDRTMLYGAEVKIKLTRSAN